MTNKNQFTLATYNIQFGFNREEIIENIVQMAKQGIDIICLQEVIHVENKEFIITSILKKLGADWDAKYHVGEERSKEGIGTAILWNSKLFSFRKQEKVLLPKINKFDLHEKFFYYVIGVAAIPLQRRALVCNFTFNQKEIRVSCIHIDNIGGAGHRMKQIAYFKRQLVTMGEIEYEIVCGDFNSFDLLKTGYEKKALQKEIGIEFVDASKDIPWSSDIHNIDFSKSLTSFQWFIKTFNVHIRRRLDYIWVKNFKIVDCKKLPIQGSDHYPLVANLEIS